MNVCSKCGLPCSQRFCNGCVAQALLAGRKRYSGLPLPQEAAPSPPPASLEVEPVAAPVEAWRAWKVKRGAPPGEDRLQEMADAFDAGLNPFRELLRPWLSGVGHQEAWKPGTMTARCAGALGADHEAPQQDCSCGVWALTSREAAERVANEYGTLVIGRVQLWGRIMVCGDVGYRAQHARPVEIVVLDGDETLARELGETYGCQARAEPSP